MTFAYHFTPTDRSADSVKDFLATCRAMERERRVLLRIRIDRVGPARQG